MKRLSLIIFYGLLIAVIVATVSCSSAGEQLAMPGETAPDITLVNLKGEAVSLSDYRGSPVLLNFWASWCGPCRSEMPFIQEIYQDPGWDAVGLMILAVNLGESATVARDFMGENGYTFPVLLDMTGEVGDTYNTRSIPTTFFIDGNGIIKYIDIGAFRSKADLEQRLFDLVIENE